MVNVDGLRKSDWGIGPFLEEEGKPNMPDLHFRARNEYPDRRFDESGILSSRRVRIFC